MLVLLPPSETKRAGGEGPPMSLDALSHHELDPVRKELLDELVELSGDVAASRTALGLSPRQDDEIARNAALWSSGTMPALQRYTGVLYDALDVSSLTGAAGARATARLAVGSALFGLLRAADPVPAYRLSAGSTLPGRPTLAARWRPVLEPVLAALATDELVVDLRSGSYAGLGRLPGAVTVTVLAERADGKRTVVSHHNKSHKGRLARLLAGTRAEPSDAAGVAAIARRAGMTVERPAPTELEIVLPL
ncbi:peroxide stress protein YaaA [Pseudonocardia sp. H11422]|uniref:peroxide stress protein YaaA n=1 Tax=Pseudonocardia sp. H11422 TaxID=2835866 RepID=UPI001BDC1C26|nr:peroxide stress protein YaaA [Pseudonocardia sp. H11422]